MNLARFSITAAWQRCSRQQQQEIVLLLVVSLVFLPHIGSQPPWISGGFAILLIWHAWQCWHGQTTNIRWLKYLLLFGASGLIWLTYHTIFGREPGTALLFLLLALKLQERTDSDFSSTTQTRSLRDLYIVIFLCFFLILAGFFESQSIPIALYLFMNVVSVVAALSFAHYGNTMPSMISILKKSLWLCVQAIPLTIVLFFLFPRANGPLWGMPKNVKTAKVGMSDNMSPGDISNLLRTDSIAMRVKMSVQNTNDSVPLASVRSQLYWRGPVLGEFDGRTWRPLSKRTYDPNAAAPHFQINRPRTAELYQYTATLEAQSQNWLFLLDMPTAIPRLETTTEGEVRISNEAVATHTLPPQQRLRYTASATLNYFVLPYESPLQQQDWLQLPSGFNPRTLALAEAWKSTWLNKHGGNPTLNDRQELVQQALQFFRQENFRYTLNPPLLGQHTVDDFLFQTRAGFCEHYSSAFVILMRALGIPARVINGYQGAELNPIDGTWNIRQSDAHAWAEVWFDERGWLRIDPTAAIAPERVELGAERVLQAEEPNLLTRAHLSWLSDGARHLRYQWEAVNNRWNQWVLNYNKERQQSLLEKMGFDRLEWQTLSKYVLISIGGGILLAALWILPAWKKWFLVFFQKKDPICELYSDFESTLIAYKKSTSENINWQRPMYEGWSAWGQRINATLPIEWRDSVNKIITLCVDLHYGKQNAEVTQRKLKLLRTWIRSFQKAIKK